MRPGRVGAPLGFTSGSNRSGKARPPFCGCASLVLALALSACASSGGMSSGEGRQTSARGARGNPNLIVRAELEGLAGRSLWDAVQTLRGR